MADWKQITARIRRARTGKDPAAQLTALFSKTRDAMVAFELARFLESIGNSDDAGKWYVTAAQRFRRSDWKTKAQESATRLGASIAAEIPVPPPPLEALLPPESPAPAAPEIAESPVEENSASQFEPEAPAEPRATPRSHQKPHRRGRRGGRDHRRPSRRPEHPPSSGERLAPAPLAPPAAEEHLAPVSPRELETSPESSAPSLRGRSGDPGLSSRLSQLEMNFRRLLASSPATLDHADRAPAGPGVWLLTDSDLTTYYYVEACQTLRVAIPNLLRSGSVRRGDPIKPRLAEHLGIPESRVAKYLSDHCVVRWLQMDDGAAHFAHFLVAVLHPALNE